MKSAAELVPELKPFLEGKRNRVFSEIEPLLHDIFEYLMQQDMTIDARLADPSIQNQMDLDIPEPQRGDNKFRPGRY